jgi:hypothetical protein
MRRALALIAIALAVLPGCGQERHRTIPVKDLTAALDQTRDARSQRIHMDMKMKMPGVGRPMHMTGDGAIDNKTRKGRMTIDMLDLVRQSGGQIDPNGGKADEIINRFTVWMRWPPATAKLGGGKEWLKMDLQKIGEKQGFDFSALAGAQGDPTSQLDQLRAVSGDVEVIGDETVRGAPTTHYGATIDLRRYPQVAPAGDRERVRKSVDRLIELSGSSTIPTEIWVDHRSHRIVRSRFVSQYKVPQGGGTMKMDVTMELYDFGVRVTGTDPPPPETVADAADLPGAGATP